MGLHVTIAKQVASDRPQKIQKIF
ncbi:MAG: hypothetical protein JSS07_00815 [Proteobacteria bacterium]|nr:hypothetical protein [Pseudomonadota bacterium]